MTYAPGTRVVVTEFVRRGDDADISELDGWVIDHDSSSIVIANTPDFATLGEDLYWTAEFQLSDVIVSPFSYPIDAPAAAPVQKPGWSTSQWLLTVFLAGFALVVVGLCTLSAFLIIFGFAVMLPTPTIGVLAALNRKENDHV